MGGFDGRLLRIGNGVGARDKACPRRRIAGANENGTKAGAYGRNAEGSSECDWRL
jgi:hypothetical protein